jgi:hypothetical protein
MTRLASFFVFLSLAVSTAPAQAPKKEEDKKSTPITKEWLLGKWRHPKDATVTISFWKDDKGQLSRVSFVNGMFAQTSTGFEFVIDAKTNIVKMDQGKAAIGTAERTADGKLRVTAGLIRESFERIKEDKPEAKPEEPAKEMPITKKWLLGKWKGKLANGTVEVWLKEEGVVVDFEFSGGGFAIGNVGPFKIDDKKCEVQFGGATAKPTKDGALLISGQITMGLNTYNVPETRIERLKAVEPKK